MNLLYFSAQDARYYCVRCVWRAASRSAGSYRAGLPVGGAGTGTPLPAG